MTDPQPQPQDAVTYRPHFGLERNPFGPLAHCDELFDLQAGSEAAARLGHLLELSGIGVLTGQPGCGKTTVCRRFLDSLHPLRHRICHVALTTGTAFDTCRLIAWELGVEPVHTRAGCYRLIRNEILDQSQSRRQLVLLIDEAQNLRNDVLEELRLLINFDLDGKCPVCLLLVGQTALDKRLALTRNRALDQRIVMRHRFPGIAREEVEDCLEHRLRLAGCPRRAVRARGGPGPLRRQQGPPAAPRQPGPLRTGRRRRRAGPHRLGPACRKRRARNPRPDPRPVP